ncbi:hypothetical protein FA15DRAFT_204629 [Coprinopsis marcescibilis]|uniref:Uncharacterized protein n=1 Tax=Coprinopsis marcescibilis TaxID=230819 RepID=A0A5C3LC84_COPMA|nr:hypothetical protein FA15DRAFT_204629 [Coprinopsis marcescibilis]
MAEYATTPQGYFTSKQRTARWVDSYSPEAVYSPSYPPTPIEHYAPPSPAMSTHSLPPKMVLRFNDGRGDVAVPHPNAEYSRRQDGRHRGTESKSSTHSSSPLSQRPHKVPAPPTAPEAIRILPSRPVNNSSSTSSRQSEQPRSRSIPRNLASAPMPEDGYIPPVPHVRHSPTVSPASAHPSYGHPPQSAYSPWLPEKPGHHAKHASVNYPPKHPMHYDPHAYHHPPNFMPNGMIYSHSAPPALGSPTHYPPHHPAAYPTGGQERMGRTRGREMAAYPRSRRHINPNASSDSLTSEDGDNAYYRSPTGQKVHVIAPSPERSDGTSDSSTKVDSQWSQTSGKKPFLSRIFGFGGHKVVTPPPAKGGHHHGHRRKLQRRHSIGESGRLELD